MARHGFFTRLEDYWSELSVSERKLLLEQLDAVFDDPELPNSSDLDEDRYKDVVETPFIDLPQIIRYTLIAAATPDGFSVDEYERVMGEIGSEKYAWLRAMAPSVPGVERH